MAEPTPHPTQKQLGHQGDSAWEMALEKKNQDVLSHTVPDWPYLVIGSRRGSPFVLGHQVYPEEPCCLVLGVLTTV